MVLQPTIVRKASMLVAVVVLPVLLVVVLTMDPAQVVLVLALVQEQANMVVVDRMRPLQRAGMRVHKVWVLAQGMQTLLLVQECIQASQVVVQGSTPLQRARLLRELTQDWTHTSLQANTVVVVEGLMQLHQVRVLVKVLQMVVQDHVRKAVMVVEKLARMPT